MPETNEGDVVSRASSVWREARAFRAAMARVASVQRVAEWCRVGPVWGVFQGLMAGGRLQLQ